MPIGDIHYMGHQLFRYSWEAAGNPGRHIDPRTHFDGVHRGRPLQVLAVDTPGSSNKPFVAMCMLAIERGEEVPALVESLSRMLAPGGVMWWGETSPTTYNWAFVSGLLGIYVCRPLDGTRLRTLAIRALDRYLGWSLRHLTPDGQLITPGARCWYDRDHAGEYICTGRSLPVGPMEVAPDRWLYLSPALVWRRRGFKTPTAATHPFIPAAPDHVWLDLPDGGWCSMFRVLHGYDNHRPAVVYRPDRGHTVLQAHEKPRTEVWHNGPTTTTVRLDDDAIEARYVGRVGQHSGDPVEWTDDEHVPGIAAAAVDYLSGPPTPPPTPGPPTSWRTPHLDAIQAWTTEAIVFGREGDQAAVENRLRGVLGQVDILRRNEGLS